MDDAIVDGCDVAGLVREVDDRLGSRMDALLKDVRHEMKIVQGRLEAVEEALAYSRQGYRRGDGTKYGWCEDMEVPGDNSRCDITLEEEMVEAELDELQMLHELADDGDAVGVWQDSDDEVYTHDEVEFDSDGYARRFCRGGV